MCQYQASEGQTFASLSGEPDMAIGSQPRWTVQSADTQVGIDVGLRNYMLRIYNYMASALALTGIVAYLFAGHVQTNRALLPSPVIGLLILAPFGLVTLLSFVVQLLNASGAH